MKKHDQIVKFARIANLKWQQSIRLVWWNHGKLINLKEYKMGLDVDQNMYQNAFKMTHTIYQCAFDAKKAYISHDFNWNESKFTLTSYIITLAKPHLCTKMPIKQYFFIPRIFMYQ